MEAFSQTFAFTGTVGGRFDSRSPSGVAAPQKPVITATALSSISIRIALSSYSADTQTFTLERSPNGSTGWSTLSSSLTAADFPYTNSGLTPVTAYYYRLTASNTSGSSAPSDVKSATTSSSSIADGGSYRILGDFGSNATTVTGWLGGMSGAIESKANGAQLLPQTNWSNGGASDLPLVTTTRADSYSKSIYYDPNAATSPQGGAFGLTFDTGINIGRVYVSYKAYLSAPGLTQMQWKMLRLCWKASVQDPGGSDDSGPNVAFFNWLGFSNIWCSNAYAEAGNSGRLTSGAGDGSKPVPNDWYHCEFYCEPNTPGSADGYFEWRFRNMTTGQVVGLYQRSNVQFYGPSETRRYRYVVLQNYLGNETPGGSPYPEKLWVEDIYIQAAPVNAAMPIAVLGDASTFGACLREEPAPFTSQDSSGMLVTLNKGGLPTLSGWHYIKDRPSSVRNSSGYLLQ